ncbi:MAG: aminoacyl-tRNA hydrolase [Alphaproteobacteria bacterium]|nr:aminoacyl-tRNA hydrolase [Alphaproteobacteria bacterium]
MWLFVGLGNPGDKYKGNRHNIGFMVADALAADNHFPAFKSKFQGEVTEGRLAGEKIAVLKPMTYMNESGQSIGKCAKFYKIPPERVVVFYDELDLPPCKVKVKQGGGSGGHNGIKSTDRHLPSKDYWRVRLGIGHPGDKNRVSGYVLSDFSKEEQKDLPFFIDTIVRYSSLLLEDNKSDFGTRVSEDFKI